jgi:hypothetical protein
MIRIKIINITDVAVCSMKHKKSPIIRSIKVKVKVKQSRYRPGVAQRVPGN